jgi:hypothetical protein
MHLLLWLLLPFVPATFWPVTVPLLIVLIVLAVKGRGLRRWLFVAGAAAIVAPPLLGFGLFMVLEVQGRAERRAEYARTHSVLEQDTMLDNITFPAGTEIAWVGSSRTRWNEASLPRPLDFHGLPVRNITHALENWTVELAEPRRIGGWACGVHLVSVTGEGELRSCSLSETMTWNGWTLPPLTTIDVHRTEETVDVTVAPYAEAVEGQEIGRTLPGSVTLNDDGSLARAFFERRAPFLAAAVPLWGILTWRYNPATRGQGRNRSAIAVEGRTRASAPTSPDGREEEPVVVHLPDGTVTRRAPGEG